MGLVGNGQARFRLARGVKCRGKGKRNRGASWNFSEDEVATSQPGTGLGTGGQMSAQAGTVLRWAGREGARTGTRRLVIGTAQNTRAVPSSSLLVTSNKVRLAFENSSIKHKFYHKNAFHGLTFQYVIFNFLRTFFLQIFFQLQSTFNLVLY